MKFAYFAAVSVAFIAQAASAQHILSGVPYVNHPVTLTAVTPTSVTTEKGTVWLLTGPAGPADVYVFRRKAQPNELKVGFKCSLTGTAPLPRSSSKATITSLACQNF